MQGIELSVSVFGLVWGTFYYRHQSRRRDLPLRHPRRVRARKLFNVLWTFLLLCLFGKSAGADGAAGYAELIGFAGWFGGLFLYRIPKEEEVKAYEAQYGKAAPGEPEPAAASPFTESPKHRREWPQEPQPQLSKAPAAPSTNHHPRGSTPWALHELAVAHGATPEQVNAAYRRLIRMVHPDKGGDTEFAADLNLARKVLLAAKENRPA